MLAGVSEAAPVASSTVATSSAAAPADDRVANRPLENPMLSQGAVLARRMADELEANRLVVSDARRAFMALSTAEQRAFLSVWEREVKPTVRSQRVRNDFQALYVERVTRNNRARASQLDVVQPRTKREFTLAVGEIAAGAGALLIWRLGMGAILTTGDGVGAGGAIILLLIDAVATVFGVAGIQYAIADTSEHWVASYSGAVTGAAVMHGVGLLASLVYALSAAQRDVNGRVAEIQPGALVALGLLTILGPPIGAAMGSTTDVPKRRRVALADPFYPQRTPQRLALDVPVLAFGF